MPWLLGDKDASALGADRTLSKENTMTIPFQAGCPAMPRRTGPFAAALALLILTAVPLQAQDAAKDPVVATVNGTEIRESDLAVAEQEAGQIPPMSPDAKKDYLVQFMADMILVSKAAEDKKVGDTADFARKMAFARKKLLMMDLLESVAKEAVTDGAMRTVYADATKSMGQEKEVHARHILIRVAEGDEAASKAAKSKIDAVIARLKKGEDFQKVAAETTEDPSGKTTGGDLGFFAKDQMVPEFANVAFNLSKGQLSEPVKTQFGWHVIKVEDSRTKEPPPFEAVREQIEQFVVRKAQADMVTKLRTDAKIEKFYTVEAEKPAEEPKKADEPKK